MGVINRTLTVGTETNVNEAESSGNYRRIVYAKINSIDEENQTANITLRFVLRSYYTAWSGDTITFTLYIDGKAVKSADKSSGGSTSSASKDTVMVTYTGDVSYSDDGTLIADFKGAITGHDSTYAPANGSTTMHATFPTIDISTLRLFVGASYKKATPYVYINGAWKKAKAYVFDGEWKKCK